MGFSQIFRRFWVWIIVGTLLLGVAGYEVFEATKSSGPGEGLQEGVINATGENSKTTMTYSTGIEIGLLCGTPPAPCQIDPLAGPPGSIEVKSANVTAATLTATWTASPLATTLEVYIKCDGVTATGVGPSPIQVLVPPAKLHPGKCEVGAYPTSPLGVTLLDTVSFTLETRS